MGSTDLNLNSVAKNKLKKIEIEKFNSWLSNLIKLCLSFYNVEVQPYSLI